MHFTPYVKYDGYYESICHLKKGLGPILKCRAVVKSDGTYDSIVRDYSTDKMVASKIEMMSYGLASDMAEILAVIFIISELDDIMAGREVRNGNKR